MINIRIGLYHFQVYQVRDWRSCGIGRISRNEMHRGYPQGIMTVYKFFRWGN